MYHSDYRNRVMTAIEKFRFPLGKFFRKRGEQPRKIETAKDLIDALEHRASTETQLRPLFYAISGLLSPPACLKYHCEHHTAYSYCNCRLERAPHKCPEHRAFKKRLGKRLEKQRKEIEENEATYTTSYVAKMKDLKEKRAKEAPARD